MTVKTLHPIAADYLARFDHEAKRLPRGRRRELRAELEDHLGQAIPRKATESQARTALDRLGRPEEIVDAEQPPLEIPAIRGVREWAAIFLLLLGGFLGGVGWLVGVILLWSSRAWSTRDKLIGTLVLPGGLVLVFIYLVVGGSGGACTRSGNGPEHCAGAGIGQTALALLLLLAPLATSVYLAQRSGRNR